MDERSREVVFLNVARFERLLETEADPEKRRMMLGLLTDARNEAMLFNDQTASANAAKTDADLRRDSKRWRMRAEEYRTIADGTQNAVARGTYLSLAQSYDLLADRAEMTLEADKTTPKTG